MNEPLPPEYMSALEARDTLWEITPIVHAMGHDEMVEALAVAADALTWFPLRCAPRDGTYILLAIAPHASSDPRHHSPGYVVSGRWVEPSESTLAQMGRDRRRRYEASSGWWSSAAGGRPFRRPVLAWRPIPTFDFQQADLDRVETIGGVG